MKNFTFLLPVYDDWTNLKLLLENIDKEISNLHHNFDVIILNDFSKIKHEFNKVDIILSPAVGGIVVGYEIARQLKIATIFAERVDDKFVLRRDFKIKPNSNVVIVEDVITTGKSALDCSNIVNTSKANLLGYACIIDRTNKNISIKDKIVSQMKFHIETFSEDELPSDLKKITPTKPGSRNLSK